MGRCPWWVSPAGSPVPTAAPEVGRRIALLRRRLGLSQVAFGRGAGISRTSLLEYERGDRVPKTPRLPGSPMLPGARRLCFSRVTSGYSDVVHPVYRQGAVCG
jgi:Helix-turn-helix domain